MSKSKQIGIRQIEVFEAKNRKLIIIWIIIITTFKVVIIDVGLFAVSKILSLDPIDLKVSMATDTVLFGTILRTVVKHYFPEIKSRNDVK
jgi:hypothetical protein